MKALLKILYFFLILLVIFFLTGIFLPKSTRLTTNILIHSAPGLVFEQINTLNNWNNWAPWLNYDTTNQISFNDIKSGVGASCKWENEITGMPEISITESQFNKKIVADFDFGKQGKAKSTWSLYENSEGTKIEWNYENYNLKYYERYFLIFFKKNMLRSFNSGLERLKETCEDLNFDRISDVSEVIVSQKNAIVIYDSSDITGFDEKKNMLISKIESYLVKRNLNTIERPVTIYFKGDGAGLNKYACGLPVIEKTWSWQEYQLFTIDSCRAIKITHWGKYGSDKPFKALTDYLNDHNLMAKDYSFEVYINDPTSEKDTSKWKTEIFYPLN